MSWCRSSQHWTVIMTPLGTCLGGAVILGPTAVPHTLHPQPSAAKTTLDPTGAHPIVWRAQLPEDVSASLVYLEKPTNQVTNSDLELSGIVIHRTCMADCYDFQERTTLSWTENMAGMWWQQKGSATLTSPPARLL